MTPPEAIGRMEGVLIKGSRPERNNNPGDIEYGQFAELHGATGGDPRFAIFPSMEMGYACLVALLKTPGYYHLTWEAAINRYAPPVENATVNYVRLTCEWLGCQPTDLVSTLMEGL